MKRTRSQISKDDSSQSTREKLKLPSTVQDNVRVPPSVPTGSLFSTLEQRNADYRLSPGNLVGVPAQFDATVQFNPSKPKSVGVTTNATFGLKNQGNSWVQAYLDTGGSTTWESLAKPHGDMDHYLTNIGRVSRQLSGHPSKDLVSGSTRKTEAEQQGKQAHRFVATALNEESTGSLSGVQNAGRALLAAAFNQKMQRRLKPNASQAKNLYPQLEQAAPQIKGGGAVELSQMSSKEKEQRLYKHHNATIEQSFDLAVERFAAKKETYDSIMKDKGIPDVPGKLRKQLGVYWAETDQSAMSASNYARRKLKKWAILPGD